MYGSRFLRASSPSERAGEASFSGFSSDLAASAGFLSSALAGAAGFSASFLGSSFALA